MSKIINRLKNIIYYLGACFCALLFALFCSGRGGYFMLGMLVLAPIFSVIYTAVAWRFIKISAECDRKIISKGSDVNLIFYLKNNFFLPLPMLSIWYSTCAGLEGAMFPLVVFMTPFEESSYEVTITGTYAGKATVEIKDAQLCDFMGLYKKNIKVKNNYFEIGVIPDIPEIESDNQKLQQLLIGAQGEKELEETLDISAGTFGGFPGYEHREYQPGDPIKRINYKLSARKNELYVRLDEKQAKASLRIEIDPLYKVESGRNNDASEHSPGLEKEEKIHIWWQERLEEAMGIAGYLVDIGYEVCVCLIDRGNTNKDKNTAKDKNINKDKKINKDKDINKNKNKDGNKEYVIRNHPQLQELCYEAAFWSFVKED